MSPEAFRAFSRMLPDAHLLVTIGGKILVANSAALRALGPGPVEEGANLMSVLADDPPRVLEYFRMAARTSGPVTGAFTVRHSDGSERSWVCLAGAVRASASQGPPALHLRLEPRTAATARFRLLTEQIEQLSREIRRRRDAERDRSRHLEALESAKEEAEAASHAKSGFMATISHELRTPLSAVIGYAELLREGIPEPVGEGARAHVDRILLGARHLQQVIDEILTFSRLEVGRVQADLRPLDVEELLAEVRAVVEPLARERGLAFSLSAPASLHSLRTDPGKLRQILLNLLGNAVEFTGSGEVHLEVAVGEGEVLFRVTDTGLGIAAEDMKHLFEPFWQADSSHTREIGGTGLGLTITHHFVDLLGGEIEVESEPGQGSAFTVRLPLDAEGAAGRGPDAASGPGRGPEAERGPDAAPGAERGAEAAPGEG